MLTTQEEDRLEEVLPLENVDVEYEGETHQYTLSPHWAGSDAVGDDSSVSPDYPAIVLEWENQAEEDESRRPLGGVYDVEAVDNEPLLREQHVARLGDVLSMTVAVEATHDANGVPPQVRAGQLTRHLWRYARFQIDDDLGSAGANGERPMVVDVLDEPTPGRVERTFRLEWSIRLRYVDEYAIDRDAVDDAEFDVSME